MPGMENQNVINGLLRRRQEIADKLELVQTQLRQLILDIDAVDSTLRLFQPGIEIGMVRVKPIPRRHAAERNEASRLIYTVLREAREPLTTRGVALAIMQARGMNTADIAMAETMRLRLATSLRKLRSRGKLVAEKEGGRNMRWALAK